MEQRIKTFLARNRVYVFSAQSATGYTVQGLSVPTGDAASPLPDAYGIEILLTGAVQVSIVHGFGDASYGFIALPTWPTTVWELSRGANQVDFLLSTPAPLGGLLYWEGLADMPFETVVAGATSVLIPHNENSLTVPIFAMLNWNSTVWDSVADRNLDDATLKFSTPVPVGGGVVLWKPAS